MIAMAQPLAVGNAVRLLINPPQGAAYWRVLRRTADAFTGATDSGAVLVADQSTDNGVLDTCGLVNGTTYFWRDYAWVNGAWVDSGASISATPAATYGDQGPDVQAIVRERLALAMAVEVARGTLKPASGSIVVTTAPFALMDGIKFPTISVHMDATAAADRFIGDGLAPGLADLSFSPVVIDESEGWLAQTTLAIIGVSLNSDERIALREAIRRAVIGNIPVFAAAGILQVGLSQRDTEDLEGSQNAILYRTENTFTCLAPTAVTAQLATVTDVNPTAIVNGDTFDD